MKSVYSKNILTLLTGNAVAQAVPIVISPILTRLYSPEDFGVAGLFASITAIFSAIINAKYEAAIILPKDEEDAYAIAMLSLLISVAFTFLLLFIVIVFHENLLLLLGTDKIDIWLYFIPLVVLLSGLFNVLNYLNTREKNFRQLSKIQIYKSLSTSFVQVLFGFVKSGAFGLIAGQIISNFVGNVTLLRKTKLFKFKFVFSNIINMGKKYKHFPIYYLPNNIVFYSIGTLSTVFISSIFGIYILGLYSMANRILGLSGMIIGSSVSQVYAQHVSYDRNNNNKKSIKHLFERTLLKLILIGLPIFLFSFFFLEDIFRFVFGKAWAEAGYYAEILSPFFFFRFLSTSLNTTTLVLEKQHIELLTNLVILSSLLILFFLTYIFNINIIDFLTILTVLLSVLYAANVLVYYLLILKETREEE